MRAEDKSLPREVSAFHLTAIKKAMVIAFRDNKEPIEIKCKKCGEKLTIQVNDPKSELNTVKMLEILYDRMFPKLASLTHEVNIAGQIVQVTEGFVGIIAKYVPAQDRLMAIGEMQQLIERLKYAAETGSEENNVSNLPLAITG
jgi:PHP family Zn ribbon phosphoesterase